MSGTMSTAEPFDLEAWLEAAASAATAGGAATEAPDAAEPDRTLANDLLLPPIIQAGARVLRRRAVDVPSALFGTPTLLRLAEVMTDVMRAAPGVGLAAPQIGVPLRIFVAEDAAERLARVAPESLAARARAALPLMALVNPTVTLLPGEPAVFFEGCLSVRGYGALVSRAPAVRVTALDLSGAPVAFELQGWPARIMQHEMDHLDGTLYIDRMLTRSFAGDAAMGELAGLPVSEVLKNLVER